ncbi:unnamed protein product, partial [Phaeothamnion confervicola]
PSERLFGGGQRSIAASVAAVADTSRSLRRVLTGVQQRFLEFFLACLGDIIHFACAASSFIPELLNSAAVASEHSAGESVVLRASGCSDRATGRSGGGSGGCSDMVGLGGDGGGSAARGASPSEMLQQGILFAVLAVGALHSGGNKDAVDHSGLVLCPNFQMQSALHSSNFAGSSAGGGGSSCTGGGGGGDNGGGKCAGEDRGGADTGCCCGGGGSISAGSGGGGGGGSSSGSGGTYSGGGGSVDSPEVLFSTGATAAA